MRPLFKRALSGVAALGLTATLVPILASPATAAPGAQPDPALSPSPVATATTPFGFTGSFACDGPGSAGYRAHTFIVDNAQTVSTLDFSGGTSGVPGYVGVDQDSNPDGTIAHPLIASGSAVTDIVPAESPAGAVDASTALSGMNFDTGDGWDLQDGVYKIGFVCTENGVLRQWWAKTVTIDTTPGGGTSFMTEGTAPAAPSITSVNVDNGKLIIDFSGTGATNWTAQATTTSGDFTSPVGTSTTATSDSNNIEISGLTNGTSYWVRVLANKTGFTSVPSAQSGPAVPETNGGAVQALEEFAQGLDDGTGSTFSDIQWLAPTAVGSCTVTGYDVSGPSGTSVAQPSPAPGAPVTSARVTDLLTNSTQTITVTPEFDPGCVGTPTDLDVFIVAGNLVIQDIDVTRPIGALVLTQVCGSNGYLPGEGLDAGGAAYPSTFNPDPASDTGADDTPGANSTALNQPVVGFDSNGALPPIEAVRSSTVDAPYFAASSAAQTVSDPAGLTEQDQDSPDPSYIDGEYPYPIAGNGDADPLNETFCGLDLGPAEFVTQGEGAGQYFAADGAMNQVSVVDTRNVDAGWDITGEMGDFVASSEAGEGAGSGTGLDTFSGDFLGWTPVVTENTSTFDSNADGVADYDQVVTAGAPVRPNTLGGVGAGALAVAPEGAGLGTAIVDARIKLLIPVTADAGLYEGQLTFSAL